ncbi:MULTISPECIES: cytochrome-c oxidase, cbb3-type subunit II [Ochrobactrum]|jgi:cytochrome c oxidase cbb3-type subunit 2|uniref:Cytochrome c oxidase, cbb3-type, subunit II n=1 Tax=Ochrobactrum quorumnocens TaxID=271865 RepID=A0A248UJI7_9HYPH|nr:MULTISPECIES: cytochrome-c oxidase, cbb3-type subunit II [Brucella/Ochrobactrum group]MBD7993640.1 cytochrome-c oxidase, cbb3-type subunit II [Ochrobactrum gallinarum]ASV86429.1 cytochrome c oxidase, cbb3-type, subunit II [[Ochrobactrum] quorumnocens]KAA9353305.1 cytochrome-c oxidase, cbb3-type subunit II [[Ochrobactrum] quorumnocens]MCV9909883.1 cytochrome-c oxidase, cbb3-type subunit II [Brucella sp. HL-2]MDH7793469.1 cytochrome c oxidase cbb3-type subunit 2 [Ochrobactrum sp. AN78]
MSILKKHSKLERNATLLLIASLAVVTVGGIVEIAPLFYLENTIEKVEGMRPYSPLELAGRDIYVREGCYLCHSQMIRPFRDEVERYGHYSLAAESMYDHSFQWGSKRTGPDLARVGGRYSNEWHVQHLIRPRDVVPESVMPSYAFLKDRPLDANNIAANLKANVAVGVPYTPEMVDNALADLKAQADPNADTSGVEGRYPKARVGDFDGNPQVISEMDALIAYLQMLGTLVDFSTYDQSPKAR